MWRWLRAGCSEVLDVRSERDHYYRPRLSRLREGELYRHDLGLSVAELVKNVDRVLTMAGLEYRLPGGYSGGSLIATPVRIGTHSPGVRCASFRAASPMWLRAEGSHVAPPTLPPESVTFGGPASHGSILA